MAAPPEAQFAAALMLRTADRIAALKATPAWERRAEAVLHGRLRRLLSPALDRIMKRITRLGHVPTAATARVFVRRETKAVLDGWRDVLEAAAVDAAKHGRRRTIADLRRAGQPVRIEATKARRTPVVAVDYDEYSQQILELIHGGEFQAAEETMARITGDVLSAIEAAYTEGVGIVDAANRLRSTFSGLLEWQLRTIARTEINGYSQLGSHQTLKELKVEFHEWITAHDDRVRMEHQHLHGQVVKVGQKFANGLLHPGDRTGPPEEWINCRCRAVPYLGDAMQTPFFAAI